MQNCQVCGAEMRPFLNGLYDDRYGYPGVYSLLSCGKCHFTKLATAFTQEALSRLYTDYYPRKNLDASVVKRLARFRGTLLDKMTAYCKGNDLNSHFHARRGESVLEIGCGTGTSLLELKNIGAHATGTEYDQNVRPIAETLGLDIHFGGIDTLPVDSTFDMIALNQVIEHVPNAEELLKSLRSRLKPDGRIVLSFPNFDGVNRRLFGRRWINWHVPYHLSFFSIRNFSAVADRAGYLVESSRTITPVEWFKLQVLESLFPGTPNRVSPTWNPYGDLSKSFKWVRKATTLFAYFLTPILRMADVLRLGDGILIVLTPQKISE